MKDSTREDTLHSIDKIKTFTDQLEELCEVSSMTQGEYKMCEKVFNSLRLSTDDVEDNVKYSG